MSDYLIHKGKKGSKWGYTSKNGVMQKNGKRTASDIAKDLGVSEKIIEAKDINGNTVKTTMYNKKIGGRNFHSMVDSTASENEKQEALKYFSEKKWVKDYIQESFDDAYYPFKKKCAKAINNGLSFVKKLFGR